MIVKQVGARLSSWSRVLSFSTPIEDVRKTGHFLERDTEEVRRRKLYVSSPGAIVGGCPAKAAAISLRKPRDSVRSTFIGRAGELRRDVPARERLARGPNPVGRRASSDRLSRCHVPADGEAQRTGTGEHSDATTTTTPLRPRPERRTGVALGCDQRQVQRSEAHAGARHVLILAERTGPRPRRPSARARAARGSSPTTRPERTRRR